MHDVKVTEAAGNIKDYEVESYEYKAIVTPTKDNLDKTIKNIVEE